MSNIGQSERASQDRVIKLFVDELGYSYLGDWHKRDGNSNIEVRHLEESLERRGYTDAQISKALFMLKSIADHPQRSLYENNKHVYRLLRYGADVKIDAGKNSETVHLIDWHDPSANDFGIAEEVTLKGSHERRPDLVLYVNGIAVGVIELKNSRVSIGDGIRQNISNQSKEFNEWFFSTVQILFAGSDSEGLSYGAIGTPEKYYLRWKEDETANVNYKLDKYLVKMCSKERLIELMHDFVLFDGGVKKLPRVHQYLGVKAAQVRVNQNQGGIIWHTQGTGKSLVMVYLARWLLENKPDARVVVVTDREDLDQQIHDVFTGVGEAPHRAQSGRDLLSKLGQPEARLICSLVHKFGHKGEKDFEKFIKEVEAQPPVTTGAVFVFVDECHRTQSGKLHRTMKAIMPGAVFVGFTGTPLLKKDKKTTLEVFPGGYIHTYKFSEAVEDEVVLDLVYEARNVTQKLASSDYVDDWFKSKTKPLNAWQKAALREEWGNKQKVLSSAARMGRIAADIAHDFGTKPRLSGQRGTAMLVAGNIYEACRYYEFFRTMNHELSEKCAVITSYNPAAKDITLEDTGASTQTEKEFIYNLYTEILETVKALPGMTKTESYEKRAKDLFKKQPANMRLLVVVDKLLTGFDAPSCSYLYIDKSMQDHGLFQAICRTNRLDGADKDLGYIVDYKDLFKRVEKAIAVYSSDLEPEGDNEDSQILLQSRLTKGRERLENAREAIALLCEPVKAPKDQLDFIHYFCGNTEIPDALREHEPQRVALYKATAVLVRSFASISDELEASGYEAQDAEKLKKEVADHVKLRETIRHASGETIDLKAYEADMRHLIDTYVEADAPKKVSPFDDMPLMELIVKSGIADAINSLPAGIKKNPQAVGETIANNVRSTIIKKHLTDPAYYSAMSKLLDEILKDLKEKQIEYQEYLKKIAELAQEVHAGHTDEMPKALNTAGRRALYNNLDRNETLAIELDDAVKAAQPDGWRGVMPREQVVKKAMYDVLKDPDEVERMFPIIKQHPEY